MSMSRITLDMSRGSKALGSDKKKKKISFGLCVCLCSDPQVILPLMKSCWPDQIKKPSCLGNTGHWPSHLPRLLPTPMVEAVVGGLKPSQFLSLVSHSGLVFTMLSSYFQQPVDQNFLTCCVCVLIFPEKPFYISITQINPRCSLMPESLSRSLSGCLGVSSSSPSSSSFYLTSVAQN